jgi:hypothetical protein
MITKLTKRQLYDYHDIDPWELKLIRVGHALWALLRKSRKSQPLLEIEAIEEAIQTVARLKREYRTELALRRAAKNAAVREKFAVCSRQHKRCPRSRRTPQRSTAAGDLGASLVETDG